MNNCEYLAFIIKEKTYQIYCANHNKKMFKQEMDEMNIIFNMKTLNKLNKGCGNNER